MNKTLRTLFITLIILMVAGLITLHRQNSIDQAGSPNPQAEGAPQ
jgi:hypothetical protein